MTGPMVRRFSTSTGWPVRRPASNPDQAAPSDVTAGRGRVDGRRGRVEGRRSLRLGDGDTTHLCAIDAEGLGISLTQSNCLDFGSHVVAGSTGIFLHNRGLGYSLVPGHPAELASGRRPPHTLSPLLATTATGRCRILLAPWEATGNRRSFCKCWPGCCLADRTPPRHWREPACRWTPRRRDRSACGGATTCG